MTTDTNGVGTPLTLGIDLCDPAQVDERVALYEADGTLVELGERFGVHRPTAAAHLIHRSVPIRRHGLDECLTSPKQSSCMWAECGRTEPDGVRTAFGVSPSTVWRLLAAEDVAIRPNGWRAQVSV